MKNTDKKIPIFALAKEKQERHPELRNGQAIYIVCYESDKYRKRVVDLAGTEFDCFYDDSRIEKFLNKVLDEVHN